MYRAPPPPARGLAFAVCAMVLLQVAPVSADDGIRPPLRARIDAAIESGLAGHAAPEVDDATFCRRLYLDLAGRIPSVVEARAFVTDASPDKRERLVDTLLAAPEFARNLALWLDVTLMERRADKHVPAPEWRKYLFDSALANKPYDQLVREVLAADGVEPAQRPAAKFYLDRDGEPLALTRDVGRVFLGMDLQCAQCHDHPLINDYLQADYHGLFAFLNRSLLYTDKDNKAFMAEKAEGDVSYQSVFDPSAKGSTGPRLPFGPPLVEPAFTKGEEYVVTPADKVRPVPKHSRRMLLSTALTDGTNRAFNRNIANRLWAFMMGRGLVEPLDFQHSDNPPSQPELLELLADEIVVLKYDMRAFLCELALTRAYARSIDPPTEPSDVAHDASRRLAELQAECERRREAADVAQKSAKSADKQLTGMVAAEQSAVGETAQAQAALAVAEKAVSDAEAAMQKSQEEMAAKQLLAQTLSDAATKAQEAAGKLADDQELAAAVATIKGRGEKVAAELAALTQTMSQCQTDMDVKRGAVATQRDAVTQCAAKVELARAEAVRVANEWRAAIEEAERAQNFAADAEQLAAWMQLLVDYRAVLEAIPVQETALRDARARLVVAVEATRAPLVADTSEANATSSDVSGANVILAAARERITSQQRVVDQLATAIEAVQKAEQSLTAAQSAAPSARQTLSEASSRRCLSAGLSALSPEQMAWSMWQALGVLDQQRAAAGAEWDAAHPAEGATETPEQRTAARAAFVEQKVYDNMQGSVGTFVNLFAATPGQPQQVFQATADQALFLANGGELRSWLAPGGGNLTERLNNSADAASFCDELYMTVLTRKPSEDEVAAIQSYLAGREQDRATAVQEIVWALVTSAEFRFGT